MTAPTAPTAPTTDHRPRLLRRCLHERMLGGVAAGAAEYLDVDPMVVRIGLVVLALIGGVAFPLYAAAWLLIPDEESDTSIADQLARRYIH